MTKVFFLTNDQSFWRMHVKDIFSKYFNHCPAHQKFWWLCFFFVIFLHDFLYFKFLFCLSCLASVKKVNKLLHNILATSLPKTSKNHVTKMRWKAHMNIFFINQLSLRIEKQKLYKILELTKKIIFQVMGSSLARSE